MASVKKIAQLLQERFNNGEYPERKYPSLRDIAAEMGCSYMTAFRAMHYLQEQNETRTDSKAFPLVAMISGHWRFTPWHQAVRESTMELGGQLRFITYSSFTDPVITQTLNEKFDLVFLDCPVELGSPLFKVVQKNKDHVVVLFQDLTQYGIRCMNGIPAEIVITIMQDLAKFGIRKIDMIGQASSGIPDPLQVTWKKGVSLIGGSGHFYGYPHVSFNEEARETYLYLKEHLTGKTMPEAFFCQSTACVPGVYRLLFDFGLVPGKDISVFSFGEKELAELMVPPLATAIDYGLKEMVKQVISEYIQKNLSSTKMFKLTEQVYYKGGSLVPAQLKDEK